VFFPSPLFFYHDAFMHHTIHVLDAPGLGLARKEKMCLSAFICICVRSGASPFEVAACYTCRLDGLVITDLSPSAANPVISGLIFSLVANSIFLLEKQIP